jgi:hypothetical protein
MARDNEWNRWQSQGGSFYATRLRYLTEDEIKAGLAATVAADSLPELEEKLAEQADLESQLA